MGKASKKLGKIKNSRVQKAEVCVIAELKERLNREIADSDYDVALETLAQLIEKKCYDPEVLYQGAQVYFLMGDYERSAAWVNNTLHYAPGHIGVRLLLARLCFLEDRPEEAVQIYDFVLQHYGDSLTEAQQKDIEEAADYTLRTDKEWLQENYPRVASFLEDGSLAN